jgi:hypothetical protein
MTILDLLKKIIALVPVGHELYETLAKLLQELCARVTASEDSVRETREMLLARADQVGELTTRLASLENLDRVPELATAIKDVRLTSLEDALRAVELRLAQLDHDPDVRFVRADLPPAAPTAGDQLAAASSSPPAAPPAAPQVQCAFHPYAPMNGSQCLFPECSWPGIDSAA